jgi:hypothetical protein
MSIEAGVVVDLDRKPIYWHEPLDRGPTHLADSRDLWDVLWENRHNLSGFAHSHPGSGIPEPSGTDLTTFSAVELGLGIRLFWWITSADRYILARWEGPGPYDYTIFSPRESLRYTWIDELRLRSQQRGQ